MVAEQPGPVRFPITVNNIGPGAISTPIDADVEAHPQMEAALMAEIPLGRWGKPEEVASLAVFLASDDAAEGAWHVMPRVGVTFHTTYSIASGRLGSGARRGAPRSLRPLVPP